MGLFAKLLPSRLREQKPQLRSPVIVGGWLDPDTGTLHYLKHHGSKHVLCFAPSGSGKGVGLIIPTLLSLNESVVVTDIKGENWLKTAGFRKAAGQRVLMFNPTARPLEFDADGRQIGPVGEKGEVLTAPEAGSCQYNPLAEIRFGTEQEVADIQVVANILIESQAAADPHWDDAARGFFVGLLLHLAYTSPDKCTLADLRQFMSELPLMAQSSDPEADPIKEAFLALTEAEHAQPGENYYWMQQADSSIIHTHPVVRAMAASMSGKASRERSGVISSAETKLGLYADPIVARNTSRSDFKMRDLMYADRPVSLYLVIPPRHQARLRPLIRLMITQMLGALTESLDTDPTHKLTMLLDEFPQFGRLDAVKDAIAITRGYSIRFYLIVQSLSQLTSAYKDADKDIIGNCNIKIAYPPDEMETAERLSKMCGTTTVHIENISTSKDSMLSVAGKSHSISMQAVSRALLTPDEVMNLPGPKTVGDKVTGPGEMLVFVTNQRPIRGVQSLFFLDPIWLKRSQIPAPATSDVVRSVLAGPRSARRPAEQAQDVASALDATPALASSPATAPVSAPTAAVPAPLEEEIDLGLVEERIEPYEQSEVLMLDPDPVETPPSAAEDGGAAADADTADADEDTPAAPPPAAPAPAPKPARRSHADDFDVL